MLVTYAIQLNYLLVCEAQHKAKIMKFSVGYCSVNIPLTLAIIIFSGTDAW